MHFNTGYQADAVAMMQRFVEVFNDAEAICVPSASCHPDPAIAANGTVEVPSLASTLCGACYDFALSKLTFLKPPFICGASWWLPAILR